MLSGKNKESILKKLTLLLIFSETKCSILTNALTSLVWMGSVAGSTAACRLEALSDIWCGFSFEVSKVSLASKKLKFCTAGAEGTDGSSGRVSCIDRFA